jgi:hypothetical protein
MSVLAKDVPELSMGLVELRSAGVHSHPETLGHLAVGQSLEVVQNNKSSSGPRALA